MTPIEPIDAIDAAARILGGRTAMARLMKVLPSAIGNWKIRGVPFQRCVEIEQATAGAVTRRDLRPDDWQLIWPELAQAEAAGVVAGGEGGDV